LLYQL